MLEVFAQFRDCHGCWFNWNVARAWHYEYAGGDPPGFDNIGILVKGSDDSLPINTSSVPACL
jgi:hypothetical protein